MESHPPLTFRPASEDDFEGCLAIDHSFETDRVWQMSVSEGTAAKQIQFQMVKLPQKKLVVYPYAAGRLVQRWCASEWFLVGEANANVEAGRSSRLQAYITAATEKITATAWIFDMVVAPDYRRQGYGSHMLALAGEWARQQNAQQLITAVATQNHPAMNFVQRHGFNFCGYNEAAYQSREISLFFSLKL